LPTEVELQRETDRLDIITGFAANAFVTSVPKSANMP